MSTIKVSCYKKECQWEQTVDMTDLTKSLPMGMGKLTLSVYAGEDKADEYRVTICPEHTTEMLDGFKPKHPVTVEGNAPATSEGGH